MHVLSISLLLVAAISFLMLGCPRYASAKCFKLPAESRIWVRLLGVLGLVWCVLLLTGNPKFHLLGWESATMASLTNARRYIGGIITGLIVALYTKKFD